MLRQKKPDGSFNPILEGNIAVQLLIFFFPILIGSLFSSFIIRWMPLL